MGACLKVPVWPKDLPWALGIYYWTGIAMISGPFPLRLAKGNGCSLIHFPQWYSWQTLGIQENEVLAFWNQRYWSDLELCFLLFLFHLSNELFAAIGLGLYTGFLLWLLQRGMKNLHLLLTTCLLFVDLNMLSVLFSVCLFTASSFCKWCLLLCMRASHWPS